jgi:hypothetical protein
MKNSTREQIQDRNRWLLDNPHLPAYLWQMDAASQGVRRLVRGGKDSLNVTERSEAQRPTMAKTQTNIDRRLIRVHS